MVNYDVNKKTSMEKEFTYDEQTLITFQEMIEFNIKSIGELTSKDLK